MFYMNMRAFNEGEQAERYKANKAYEKAKARKEELDRDSRRYNSDISNWKKHEERVAKEKDRDLTTDEKLDIAHQHYPLNGKDSDNSKADKKASNFNSKAWDARYGNHNPENTIKARPMTDEEYKRATDAANRHDRRHPKNECGIFESVEII